MAYAFVERKLIQAYAEQLLQIGALGIVSLRFNAVEYLLGVVRRIAEQQVFVQL